MFDAALSTHLLRYFHHLSGPIEDSVDGWYATANMVLTMEQAETLFLRELLDLRSLIAEHRVESSPLYLPGSWQEPSSEPLSA